VQHKIVDKAGAWYSYNGDRIGQGKDNVREFLRQNPELAVEIENKVREIVGVKPASGDSKATEDADQ
jgi:recombination protein RecA